jgi:uncharacterized protein YggE
MNSRYILLLMMAAGAAWAQNAALPPSVRTTGEGTVSVKPDRAKVDIGVVTQAPTADAAGAQNAAQLQSVLTKLRGLLGQKADIRTINYSLNPVYQYPKNGGKPTIEGYSALNTVEVTSDDLPNIGKVIDTATAGGANQIQRLQFTLRDEKAARAEALRQATLEARGNAEVMAGALGLKLGKVLLIEQSTAQPVRPMMLPMNAVHLAGASTPVEAEPIEIHATVTLTVAVE